jgi:predicted  nucleic acid-binding Zn-ribbon protein
MPDVHRLAALQDIDVMIRERRHEEELGFSVIGLESLEDARKKLAEQIESRTLRLYERLAKRYERPVVPVIEHRCLGCSITVPTAKRNAAGSARDAALVTCESCGRILFFV